MKYIKRKQSLSLKVCRVTRRGVCVTDLIDHMITESKVLHKGTDMEGKFAVFHDEPAQWNERGAQGHIGKSTRASRAAS